MIKTAFMMSVKCIAIAHNMDHVRVLKSILSEYVADEMKQGSSKYAPLDKNDRINAAKPARLKADESVHKRRAVDEGFESPAAKRTAMAAGVDSMLEQLTGNTATPKAKPKAKAAASPSGQAQGGEPQTGGSGGEPQKGASGGEPQGGGQGTGGQTGAARTGAAPKAKAQSAPPAAAGVVGPLENLQALLQQWG